MLPCSSSAQMMEGCEEEKDPHMQTECNRLTEERDEAQRQLKHIKRVSQMVIEEVSVLQTQLEIEKSCRENAEALATKLNCENRKLKYLSLTSRPCLDELLPSISDCMALEADAESADAVDRSPDAFSQCQQQVKDAEDGSHDTFTHYHRQVKELRETVNSLLEEKKNFMCQIHEQQRRIEELVTQSEQDQAEMKQLRETVEQHSKTIKRFNRVSTMAAQEYEGMKDQLDLEQNLRVKAESYAHEMLVKQKEANRRSVLLLQSSEPSVQLLKALEDVASVTKTLEDERLQHQQELHSLQAQLEQSSVKPELESLRRQLELLEVEKREVEGRLEQAEKKNGELEKRVDELQDVQDQISVTTSESPGVAPPPAPPPQPPPPPPPPPPPLPRRPPPSRCNPLSSLIAIMRKTSKTSKAPAKVEPPAADDVKVKAVNEMMERIKHGVVLRPVKTQDPKVQQPPAVEEKPQESAMEELKGILETVKRSPSRGSQEPGPSLPGKKDEGRSELEVILRRRRNKAGEAGSGDEGQMSHVSSSDSLNGRRTSSDSGRDSGRDPDGPGGLCLPPDPPGPRVSPERRGSGPGPAVARRKSSDVGRERRSCSSEKDVVAASPVSNGCISSEEDRDKPNGLSQPEPSEDAIATAVTTDAEC